MTQARWLSGVWRFPAIGAALALVLALLTPAISKAAEWSPPEAVYVSETGHNLYEPFLSFWRDNGRSTFIGDPISEPLKVNGTTVQYFEKARLELQGDTVVRGTLGTEYLTAKGIDLNERPSRPRLLRGNDFDLPSTTPFTKLRSATFPTDPEDHHFFPESGHTVNSSFKLAWEQGGLARYGYPISEEFAEVSPIDGKVYTTQYFERARFEYHPETANNYSVVLSPLGQAIAAARGIDTTAVAQGDLLTYTEALFSPPPPPAPTASRPAGAPSGVKMIDVNLSEQYLTAFEGSTVVYEGYISSGSAKHSTPTGTYSIFSKLVSEDMRGPDPDLPGGAYFQPDVPYVMYFAGGGYAIHGVYWHSNFGIPTSHGCVGTPVGGASFLYNWAPIGTTVYIHY